MQLSSRLQRIADYIRPGDRIIDVGTDHAYIPIWMLLSKNAETAVATDIRPGPLARAGADAEKYGVAERLTLLQCDGLSACSPDMADTVIIAGMGGETMIGIISAASWTRGKRMILQPQTKQAELRSWLGENGYAITDASLVYDTGRIYLVWLVESGEMPAFHGIDSALLENRDPLLKPFLDDQIKRLRKRLAGVEHANLPNTELSESLSEELRALEKIYEEVRAWQR